MDIELEQRLRAIEKTLTENNAMLRKLRRGQKLAQATKIVYWIVLIALGFISIALIKPYISQLGASYGLNNSADERTSSSTTDYSDLIKTLTE